jgi:plasmid maintenance system antidote protein VapI
LPVTVKARDDLFATSLYANVIDGEVDIESLRRFDNNQFPHELFIESYHLKLATVADCLHDYFDHPELKSHGRTGALDRIQMVVLDHEYTGKETNSLVDEQIEDAGEQRKNELPSIPIFRKGFNPSALDGLDLKQLAERIGVKADALRDACNVGRRLDKNVMARLQSSLDVGEDGCVTINQSQSFTPESKRAKRMAKQLRTLHHAIAAGKDFDLNGPRRSALRNERRRGPVTFDQIRIAVERHLTDKAARRFFMDRIGAFWRGSETVFENRSPRELAGIALIEVAIVLASGAKQSRVIRQMRNGAASPEQRKAANKLRAEEAKRDRIERREDASAAFAKSPGGGWRGSAYDLEACAAFFKSKTADEYAQAIKSLVAGSIGFPVRPFNSETRSSLKAAARRGSADTVWDQFGSVLQKRIGDRMTRSELDRAHKRLARGENERDRCAGGVVNDASRRGAFGGDGAH